MRVEQGVERRASLRRPDDPGGWIQFPEDGLQVGEVFDIDEVDLIDDDHIRELNLLDEQLHEITRVVFIETDAALPKLITRAVIVEKILRIDERDERVQTGERRQALPGFVREGESLRHRQRFGDARALHEQVIKPFFTGQFRHFFEQVFAKRAADAAVGKLDQLLLGTAESAGGRCRQWIGDELGVDVDLAHVVDNHGDTAALAIGQHVVEESRLPGTEETGEDGDRQTAVTAFGETSVEANRGAVVAAGG